MLAIPWLHVFEAHAHSCTGVCTGDGKPVRIYDAMSAVAGPGGLQGDPAEAQLGRLAASLAQLDLLIIDLQSTEFKATEEDFVVVLRLSAIYFKSSGDLMKLTTDFMEKLEDAEVLKEAAAFADDFDASVKALEQGCRVKDVPMQLAAAKTARASLAQYLELAATRYSIPKVQQPYSSFRP